MKFTERQQKRLKWLDNKLRMLAEEEEIEYWNVFNLKMRLTEAYHRGQDTCATCGALFDVKGIPEGGECSSCRKHPLAFRFWAWCNDGGNTKSVIGINVLTALEKEK